jgi:phage regulator Rha-like protein
MKVVFTATLKLDDEPFTTSEVIAQYAGVDRHTVQQMTVRHQKRLEKFGVIAFEMRKPLKGSKGGRPKKVYRYNEQQATLLVTFLDNTDTVADFKTELVRQFYAMKQELLERRVLRQSGKATRLSLTDAIKASPVLNDSHDYSNFTRLVFKTALGHQPSQMRKKRGVIGKGSPRDYLNAKELAALEQRESEVAVLIGFGMDYQQVKNVLANKGVLYQTTLQTPVPA